MMRFKITTQIIDFIAEIQCVVRDRPSSDDVNDQVHHMVKVVK